MIESPNGTDDLIESSYNIFRQVQRMQVAGKVVEAKSPTGTNETTSSNVRLRDERALLKTRPKVVDNAEQTSNIQGASGAHVFIQFWTATLRRCNSLSILTGRGPVATADAVEPNLSFPGGASMLALRVLTMPNVVRNAAITAITKAVAKIANTVRWVFI